MEEFPIPGMRLSLFLPWSELMQAHIVPKRQHQATNSFSVPKRKLSYFLQPRLETADFAKPAYRSYALSTGVGCMAFTGDGARRLCYYVFIF